MNKSTAEPKPLKLQIRVREEARLRLDRICDEKGWKLAEAIDRALDALEGKSRRKRTANSAAA